MNKPTYIKVDGVSINQDWVKGLSFAQFCKDEHIAVHFSRIPADNQKAVLATLYETISGKKATVKASEVASTESTGSNPVDASPMVGETIKGEE